MAPRGRNRICSTRKRCSGCSTPPARVATTFFRQYTDTVDDQSQRLMTLRGLFDLKIGQRPPVPIDEVEPVSEIVKRFSTGAMSYGSISKRLTRRWRSR